MRHFTTHFFCLPQACVWGGCVQNGTAFAFKCMIPREPALCEDIDDAECVKEVQVRVMYDCLQWDYSPSKIITTSTLQLTEVKKT